LKKYFLTIPKDKRAFSLVELMMVVAIIGMLSTMVVGEYNALKTRAYRAEARVNLRHLNNLVEIYRSTAILPMQSEVGTTPNDPGSFWYGVSLDDYSSKDSCHNPNALGFYLTDCTQARYSYWYGSGNNPDVRTYYLMASDNGRICGFKWLGESVIYCPAPVGEFRQYKDSIANDCQNIVPNPDPITGCEGTGDP
jgi:prepilin-type N-terminal cleavage/methylation domain-containing protein